MASNTFSSLTLRILVTLSSFTFLSTVIFFLPVAHVIAFVGYLFIIWVTCWSFSRYFVEYKYLNRDTVSSANKAVIVTGCDSGFGKGVAIKLASKFGFHVFACCYSDQTNGYKELQELSKTSKGKIDLVLLDVTSDESVDAAFEFVKQNLDDNEVLWSVVNNAGLGGYHGWNWDSDPVKTYERIFSVNTIGVVRMTHKFTPLLVKSPNSRFVFLSSYAGRLSFSGMIAYCMSKHSCRVFGNCLRREMEHLNVKSVIIEPTMYKTDMTNTESSMKMFEDAWDATDEDLKKSIGMDFHNRMREGLIALMDTTRPEVDDVINTIVKAVRLNDPYPFYRVSNFFQRFVLYLNECLPEETHDVLLSGAFNKIVMKMFKLSNQYQ